MKKPNILIFMTDHQRYDTAPPFNICKTPNLDALSRESVAFTNMRCPSPHCCPSRASFFSGLYPSAHGVWNNVVVGNGLSRGLAAGVRLWSEDMDEGGYDLFFSGKWHISAEEGPADRGFREVYHPPKYTGIRRADETRVPDMTEWRTAYRGEWSESGKARAEGEILRPGYPRYRLYGVNEDPFRDSAVIDASVRHIKDELPNQEKPWLFYVGNLGPHDPYFVPQRFLDMYDPALVKLPDNYRDNLLDKPALYQKTQAPFSKLTDDEHREALRHYLAFCSYEDFLFGRLVDALKESGQYEDTVIVYTSDHGDYAGAHGLWAKGLPCFREAYRVPFMVRVPGLSGMKTVDDRASLCDFAPTVLDLAGIEYGRDRFAGRSLAGELAELEKTPAPAYSFTQSNGNELYGIQRSIESDKWKYVFNGFDYDELYDLENDPGERCNLARDGRYADVIRDMCRALWRFAKKNLDTYINPYVVTAHMPYGPGIAGDDLFEQPLAPGRPRVGAHQCSLSIWLHSRRASRSASTG